VVDNVEIGEGTKKAPVILKVPLDAKKHGKTSAF
jgi:hypothetical protein